MTKTFTPKEQEIVDALNRSGELATTLFGGRYGYNTKAQLRLHAAQVIRLVAGDGRPARWVKGDNFPVECTCMPEDESGRIATPSGSCPEHGWMVDDTK